MGTAGFVMLLALCAYTTGVWAERLAGTLQGWHVAAFLVGLTLDTWGTGIMLDLAGGWRPTPHGITGVLALSLMAVHALWAAAELWRADPRALARFHRISVFVWTLWLIPFVSGAWLAMRR